MSAICFALDKPFGGSQIARLLGRAGEALPASKRKSDCLALRSRPVRRGNHSQVGAVCGNNTFCNADVADIAVFGGNTLGLQFGSTFRVSLLRAK